MQLSLEQVLTEYVVQDLNVNPKLPFEDNSFDVITNVVRFPHTVYEANDRLSILFMA